MTGVFEKKFLLSTNFCERRAIKLNENLEDLSRWGGISGLVLFTLKNNLLENFVGIEYGVSYQENENPIVARLWASHADLIQSNGKIIQG